MPSKRESMLLRIFLGEDARAGHKPLYEALVLRAREMHLAGATVLRGVLGYGHHSRLHTAKILRLSNDLPLVLEIVDEPSKIEAFVEAIEPLMQGGLVTLERVTVVEYPRRESD